MGRRSRKRSEGDGGAGGAPVAAAPAARRPPARERPRPPWHPFPLVELAVLVGIVLCVLGMLRLDEDGGRVMLAFGLALASLGGLDTALREHFSGFKSHSTLLAGLPAVALAGVLVLARAPWIVAAGAAAFVFTAALAALRAAFRRRSGGLSFR